MEGGGGNTGRRNLIESQNSIKDVLDALDQMKTDLGSRLDVLNGKFNKLEESYKQIKQIDTRLTKLERSCHYTEVEEKRKWVVIKGLWKQPDATKFETRQHLRVSLEELKTAMGTRVLFMDFYRLKDMVHNGRTFPGLVKAKFITSDDKDLFFSRLPEVGKNKDLETITFQQDIPSFLVERFKLLDGQAYRLRKKDKVKTRVIIRNLGLQLQSRVDANSRWENIAEEGKE